MKLHLAIEAALELDRHAVDLTSPTALDEPSRILTEALEHAAAQMPEWAKLTPGRAGLSGWSGEISLAIIHAARPHPPGEQAQSSGSPSLPDAAELREMRHQRRWADLGEAHTRLAEAADEPAAAIEHWASAARICRERLDDLSGASERWRAVLELDPGHLVAYESLATIYEASEDYVALSELMRERIERTTDRHERLVLVETLADLYQHALDDPQRADEIRLTLAGPPADESS